VSAEQLPPQIAPLGQSAAVVHEIALHFALLHLALDEVPQSEFCPHDAGGAHFELLHVPVVALPIAGQSVSTLHVAVLLHFAPLQRLLTVQAASPAHVLVEHFALLQSPLTGHTVSPAQDRLLHFAPVHELLAGHAASPAQPAGVLHLALLQTRVTVHAASAPQVAVEHFALLQR
jgi:hypothetical protein